MTKEEKQALDSLNESIRICGNVLEEKLVPSIKETIKATKAFVMSSKEVIYETNNNEGIRKLGL
jgi:hypothetical protein